jgi:hypothetical protein
LKIEFPHPNDPFDCSECLELAAYEVLAQRRAVFRKLQLIMGCNLEDFGSILDYANEIISLHKTLLRQTTRYVEIVRDLEVAEHKARDIIHFDISG